MFMVYYELEAERENGRFPLLSRTVNRRTLGHFRGGRIIGATGLVGDWPDVWGAGGADETE